MTGRPSATRSSQLGAGNRVDILFQNTIVRYLFALVIIAGTFALRMWLIPFTGTGAPFVLFFGAVLVTSLLAGVGPGICALLTSLPLAAYMFVTRAGYLPVQAAFQALLFAIDGFVIIYLTFLMKKGRRAVQDANQQLRGANEEIARSMVRTREVIELAPDAFFQADLDARFTDVNQAACRMLGYERDELIGKTIMDIIPPEDVPRLVAAREYLLSPDTVQVAEWTQLRKDGTPIPVEVSSKILPDGRWQAFARDISERKRIEQTLQESEERFRLTIEEAPIGMALVALDGRFVRVNRALCEIVGYSSDELTGLTFQAITHPDDLDADLALAGQLARGEIPRYQLEKRSIRKDGTIVDILLSASILRAPDKAPLYYIVRIEDITDRKRTEKALRRSESQFRGLIEHMPDGVFAYHGGRIVYTNDAFLRLLGHDDRTALVGRSVFELLHPDDQPAVAERIRTLQQTGVPAPPREFRMIGRDGSFRSVETVGLQAQFEGQSSIVVMVRDLTERKRAEEALRISEAKYSGIVAISADAIISIDDEQRISIFNSGAERIFGYSKAEVIGTPLERLIPERFRRAHRQHIEKFASGDVIARRMGERLTTIAGLRKNGEEFPAEAAISKLQVGKKTLLTVALRDVTERKRIEGELRAANASLDAIIDNIPLMLFIKESTSLRFVRFNRAGEDLLGWPRRTFIGKGDYDLWPPEQAEFFIAKDRETLKGGKIVDIPAEPIQTRHQGVRILHTKKVPILDTMGNPMYLLGISEDITERRRIEKDQQFLAEVSVALSASLEYEQTLAALARLVVQHVADWCAVDVVDEQGQLRRLKVASADPGKAALCAVLEQMPPNRDLPYLIRAVIESKRPVVVAHVTPEYIESLAQGPEHLQALSATGLTSFVAVPLLMRGEPLGALVLGTSTPSRVYGQDELRLAETLAERAAIAMENARLYRAAVQATQLRDQVLGVVAHDLRNPLSTILLQAGALKRRGTEAERRSQKPMEAIHRAATRMNRLIQDLLDVALMESGQLSMEHARLSVRELIIGAVEMQRPLAASSSLELRVDLDRDIPEIWGDRDRLLQVFENLLGNAIKFTKAGGCITTGAASRDHEVVFWVSDTGSGIASENLPRVFDRFWQATVAGRQGAGLGLPIVKGIVEAHGGRIWVESGEGRGTTFSFTIPKASLRAGRAA